MSGACCSFWSAQSAPSKPLQHDLHQADALRHTQTHALHYHHVASCPRPCARPDDRAHHHTYCFTIKTPHGHASMHSRAPTLTTSKHRIPSFKHRSTPTVASTASPTPHHQHRITNSKHRSLHAGSAAEVMATPAPCPPQHACPAHPPTQLTPDPALQRMPSLAVSPA